MVQIGPLVIPGEKTN
uniref:Uncharacterized protein n=1 Tax=Rhizophora mucronata TaxID=61149 RepID=A0A2P2QTD5_RHIMU